MDSSGKAKEKWPRKIIHVDMDAFFAAVEQRDHPEYRGKPVIVGGTPEGRGVVSTASYEARPFGVHSAMPAAQAKRLCPEGIFLRPRFEAYQKESAVIMAILRRYTPLVESVSLDEAYLDVTVNRLGIEDAAAVATLIKQHIFAATHLTASAGVAPNLFLAKIASDFKKPDGLTVITPSSTEAFLRELPVRKIPGVGPVTEKELLRYGYKTCGDLVRAGAERLVRQFGKHGGHLYERACGRDEREVEPFSESKQYSTEETFSSDTRDLEKLKSCLAGYARDLLGYLKESGRMGRTIVLKLKYADFEQITRSRTLPEMPERWQDLYAVAEDLLLRRTEAGRRPVRLIGLGISGLGPARPPQQPGLFDSLPSALPKSD